MDKKKVIFLRTGLTLVLDVRSEVLKKGKSSEFNQKQIEHGLNKVRAL